VARVVSGRIVAVLPRALYRVEVERGHLVTAHGVAGPKRNFVRLVVGDRVDVEMSPRDTGRGRVIRKLRT
jgi:translation initiation factor IF-1